MFENQKFSELSEILDFLNEGMLVVSKEGKPVFFNKKFLEIFGFSKEDAQSFRILESVSIRATGASDEIRKAFEGGEFDIKLRTILENGKKIFVRAKGRQINDFVFIIFEDLLKIAALEERIEKLEKSIEKLSKEISRIDELRNNILTNVSHEIKTPVSVIKTCAELLEDFSDNKEVREISERIKRALDRLTTTVEELVYASSIEIKPEKKGDIRKIVESAIERGRNFAREKEVDIFLICDDVMPRIMLNENAMLHAIYALINNAIKFNKKHGKVMVEIKNREKEVEIVVSDSGIGISEEDMKKLFTPLYQVNQSATRPYEGIGLGLANAKKIIEAHGGKITAKSKLGVGSSFHVFLPK